MNNILAAQVLLSHLQEISDNAYKRATEIAIETLYTEALNDYKKLNLYYEMSPEDYLGLTTEEYKRWTLQ